MQLDKTIQKFNSKYIPVPESGCWIWIGRLCRCDYAQVQIAGVRKMAHRAAYELFVGPIPDDMDLDHVCRVRCCVNPSHLRPLTHKENILCGAGLTAKHAKKTHCIRGHPLSGPNLRFCENKNERVCRQCNKDNARAWRLARVKDRQRL